MAHTAKRLKPSSSSPRLGPDRLQNRIDSPIRRSRSQPGELSPWQVYSRRTSEEGNHSNNYRRDLAEVSTAQYGSLISTPSVLGGEDAGCRIVKSSDGAEKRTGRDAATGAGT